MHFIIGKKCFKLTNAVAALVYTYRKLEIAAQGIAQCKVSAAHARSCRRRVTAYWIEQTWRSQKCKYLRCL